jgi:hypothetical protein
MIRVRKRGEMVMGIERHRMLATVVEALSRAGLGFEPVPEEPAVKIVHRGASGSRDVIIFADEEKNAISFLCPRICQVAEEARDVLRAVNHVNASILMGKLIYIEKPGTVSAVLTIPCTHGGAGASLIMRALQTLFAVIDHAVPYLEGALGPADRRPEEKKPQPAARENDPANLN